MPSDDANEFNDSLTYLGILLRVESARQYFFLTGSGPSALDVVTVAVMFNLSTPSSSQWSPPPWPFRHPILLGFLFSLCTASRFSTISFELLFWSWVVQFFSLQRGEGESGLNPPPSASPPLRPVLTNPHKGHPSFHTAAEPPVPIVPLPHGAVRAFVCGRPPACARVRMQCRVTKTPNFVST